MSRGGKAVLCLLVLFILYLPFLNQALHIDDPLFVAMANQVLKDWLRPYSFTNHWMGITWPSAFYNSVNPPGEGYFLAGAIALFGNREWAMHLFSFLFVAVFFAAMADLGRRFGVSPLTAGLLASVSPAVMVMGHTVTPDLPAAAFYAAGIACFIRGFDAGSKKWLLFSGACATAAWMFRYTAFTLFPLILLYALLMKTAPPAVRLRRAGVALSVPVAMLAAWSALNVIIYGMPHLAAALRFNQTGGPKDPAVLLVRSLALVLYVGGTTLFPLSLLRLETGRKGPGRWLLLEALLLAGGFALFMRACLLHTWGQALLGALLFCAGVIGMQRLVAAPLLRRLKRRPMAGTEREELFLALWFAGIFLTCIVQRFVAVRRILPLVPAWVLLYLLRSKGRPRALRWGTVAATALLGLALSVADYGQAEVYRTFAGGLASRLKSPSGTAWYSGHWGFQYYMEKEGLKSFDVKRDKLQAGDRLLYASQPWPPFYLPGLETDRPMPAGRTFDLGSGVTVVTSPAGLLPLRTISRMARANFYADMNFPGTDAFLPYSFSNVPLEKFTVVRHSETPTER